MNNKYYFCVLAIFLFLEFNKFDEMIQQFLTITENYAAEVDSVKMRAIGIQNTYETMSKQRESEQQLIQSEIIEKLMELERLKTELQYLQRVESEQQELLHNLQQNQ